jgi:hypothetical protein
MEQNGTKTTVARFIAVAAALLLLTFGVFFALRQQESSATTSTPAPEVSLNTDEANKPTDVSSEDSREQKPATSGDASATPAVNGAEDDGTSNKPAAPAAPTTPHPDEFSQTGPADILAQLIAAGALAASVAAYARSRIQCQSSL